MYDDKEMYISEIRPGVYLLDEAHEATGFVVIGENKACVIDTMISYTDIGAAVKSITDKPLTKEFVKEPKFVEGCEMRSLTMPPFKEIKGGDSVDLGGRTLKIYDLPGHTPGGILLHLKEDRQCSICLRSVKESTISRMIM